MLPNQLVSSMPHVLEREYTKGGDTKLEGGRKLLDIVHKFRANPQGTALQLKDKLMEEFRVQGDDKKFSLWKIHGFLDLVTPKVSNIIQKQPDIESTLSMELNLATANLVRRACQRIALDPTAAPNLLGASDMVIHEVNTMQARAATMSWFDYQTALTSSILSELPRSL